MKHAKLTLASQFRKGLTDERIYGSFVEHLGRCVYGGIYEPGHPEADENGFREDVIALIKELGVPVVRYPGGNFVSGYNWEDGIGPRENRPKRLELAWGTTETNEFGTDEFMAWCRKAGTKPMMAVNLGTRGPDEARQLVEYCNHPGGTYLSDLRKKNGSELPYDVKLWCLGNEMDGPWQMGAKTPSEYGRIACESAKIMKWTDPTIETVLCGSSGWHMKTFGEWETTALDLAYDHVDYVSMHQYHSNSDNYLENFLAKGVETDKFIESVISALDYVQGKRHSKKRIDISFDEWNVWYHSNGTPFEKWSKAPHILEDVYNFADALVVGTMINSILRHCDRVKIACLAQLVNVIAPIMTENGGKAWKQTIFYPFFYASKYGRGYVLEGVTDISKYDTKWYSDVPDVDTAAVLSEDGESLTIFAVNRDINEKINLEVSLLDFEGFVPAENIALEDCDAEDINTKDLEKVRPVRKELPALDGKKLTCPLKPMSWNMIRLIKKNG
ncbi:MAG: alpha-N-arabinofuranosidase [Ruminococcaceae bacterium]|nr:alpha-N-arabinofuranosidase [Oscillospiraceae bacterium]